MKKIKYLFFAVVSVLLLGSCQKADPEFVHDDCSITSISIVSVKDNTAPPVNGVIDQETGEIMFTVPRADYNKWDLSRVKVRATIPYDAYCSPSLSGIKDLSSEDGYKVTVTAELYGKSKDYVLYAKMGRN